MNTKFAPFIVLIVTLLDQLTKIFAVQFLNTEKNMGLFLGIGEEFFNNSLIIILGTFSIFLLAAYFMMLRLLERHKKRVIIILSSLMGGILGNVIDRVLYGHTIDFIPGVKSSFNIADIFIVSSIFLLIYLVLKRDSPIIRNNELRNIILVNKKEQFRMAKYFALTALMVSSISGVFTYTFFRYYHIINKEALSHFVILYSILTVLSTSYAFIMGILLSHKSVGALYAFEKFILESLKGDTREFKLRERDDFKHLEQTAVELSQMIKNNGKEHAK